MSKEYPYEVRDPQRSMEWTAVGDTFNAWASVRAFLKLKGYKTRELVDAPRVFEVRHPRTDPAAITEVRVSVPLRIEMHVQRRGFHEWVHVVGRTTAAHEESLAALEEARARIAELEGKLRELEAPTRLVVTRRSDDVHAAIDGSGGRLWDRGTTADAAIGALVRTHGGAFGIEVVGPEAPTS